MVTFNNGGIQRKHLKLPGSFCTPYQSKNGTPVKNLIIAIICKSTRNWRMFVTLQKMASLLIWTHFRMVLLTVCTQKVPLIDLDISARDSAIFLAIFMLYLFHSFMNLDTKEFLHPSGNQKKFDSGFSYGLMSPFPTLLIW